MSGEAILLAMFAVMVLACAVCAAVRWSRRIEFRGRTVLIAGGSRGLGLIMARQLAREGVRLAVCARTTAELDRARVESESLTSEVLAIPCDVTQSSQVRSMIEQVESRFGPIEVLSRYGQSEVILTLQANVVTRLHALFPGISIGILGLVNRMLPGPGGIGPARARGKESYSQVSPSILTVLGDKAAAQEQRIAINDRWARNPVAAVGRAALGKRLLIASEPLRNSTRNSRFVQRLPVGMRVAIHLDRVQGRRFPLP